MQVGADQKGAQRLHVSKVHRFASVGIVERSTPGSHLIRAPKANQIGPIGVGQYIAHALLAYLNETNQFHTIVGKTYADEVLIVSVYGLAAYKSPTTCFTTNVQSAILQNSQANLFLPNCLCPNPLAICYFIFLAG